MTENEEPTLVVIRTSKGSVLMDFPAGSNPKVLHDQWKFLPYPKKSFDSWLDFHDHAKPRRLVYHVEGVHLSEQPKADDLSLSLEEFRLRRMLCFQRHGLMAYMDDGEAQYSGDGHQPPIDYLRTSADRIQKLWCASFHTYSPDQQT